MPTVRLTLRIGSSMATGRPSSMAGPAALDELLVEGPVEPVVLADRVVAASARRGSRAGRGWARGRARAPSSGRRRPGCRAPRRGRWPPASMRKPSCGEQLAHLLGDELEEVDDELGLAGEALAQLRVLRGDADRARVEVADPHHHAAAARRAVRWRSRTPRRPSSAAIDDVAAGLQLAVGLHDDAVAQAVEQQRLLRLGQAELPRRAGVLQRREGRGAGAAVVARDEHDVGLGLADPGGHRADADLGHQLHVDARPRVGVLEVVDELLEVLDGVDVVVGRRRDQPDARRRVPGLGDPRVHLVAGQLAALARLGALGHLDLQVVGVDQVLARDAEAARRHLLDGRAPGVAVGQRHVALGVLAALAGVALAAEAVHGDGEGLVGLGRDRAVGHGPGREALDDLADRLDLVERAPAAGRRGGARTGPAGWPGGATGRRPGGCTA